MEGKSLQSWHDDLFTSSLYLVPDGIEDHVDEILRRICALGRERLTIGVNVLVFIFLFVRAPPMSSGRGSCASSKREHHERRDLLP